MKIESVAIIGGGSMGTGIAQIIAEKGIRVKILDLDGDKTNKSLENIETRLHKKAEKNRILNAKQILDNISLHTSMKAIKNIDLIIEAIPEDLESKKLVFSQIDKMTTEDAILATNTSGLSIADISSVTSKPERVIGFHFFYPAPIMNLVEVIPSIITDKNVHKTMIEFAHFIGKKPVTCRDLPGFIVNRILVPMVNEATYCVMEGAKVKEVDLAMKLGANHKMGPLTLADFVGLDVLLSTMNGLYNGFQDSKYRPCPLLKKIVESGHYGIKNHRGFYFYDENKMQLNEAL